ncbi:MAG TPA: hypothetical protein VGP02_14070 [Mycobacteriales bacterium]|jgi:hypothetical protein|nr:hypothetical protein [Mycobacteriales bacterium]
MMRGLLRGAAAGAAGTTALDAVTYADMALRGRPASSTPERSIESLAGAVGLGVPGDRATRENRLHGLGAFAGIATGVGVGALLGVARELGWRPRPLTGGLAVAGAALVAANGPMVVLGITDPRTWSTADWIADLVPHLAYGLVTYATLAATDHAE